jgi:hypothetical protein
LGYISQKKVDFKDITGVVTDLENKSTAELQMDSSEWPEKKYLLYQESQNKSISRLRSTDSLVLSSPIQPQEGKAVL